ncbi:MAG: hypothetical protein MZU95_00315 [Desulfomicrobium escambiense]|nr:hypothetical protein [Desulfomicrobium escambiense]
MKEVVIAGYLRTALSRSRPNEPARDWFCRMRADELLAKLLPEVIQRTGIKAEEIDDFLVGCATAVGEQWAYGGRIPIFMANLPQDHPGQVRRPAVRLLHGRGPDRLHGDRPGVRRHRAVRRLRAHDPRGHGHEQRGQGPARPQHDPFPQPRVPALGHDDHHEHGADGREARGPDPRSRARRWTDGACARTSWPPRPAAQGFFKDEILPIEAEQADGSVLRVDTDQAVRDDATYRGPARAQARLQEGRRDHARELLAAERRRDRHDPDVQGDGAEEGHQAAGHHPLHRVCRRGPHRHGRRPGAGQPEGA